MRHTTHNPGCNQRAQLEAINNFVKEDNEVRVSKDKEERVILDAPRVSKDKEVREKNTIQETTPEVVEDNVIDKCLDLLQQLSIQLKLLKKNKTIIVPEINVLALLEKTETKIVPEIVPEIVPQQIVPQEIVPEIVPQEIVPEIVPQEIVPEIVPQQIVPQNVRYFIDDDGVRRKKAKWLCQNDCVGDPMSTSTCIDCGLYWCLDNGSCFMKECEKCQQDICISCLRNNSSTKLHPRCKSCPRYVQKVEHIEPAMKI